MLLLFICRKTITFIGESSSWLWTMLQFFVYLVTLIAIIRQIGILNKQSKIQNNQLKDQININIVTILNSLHEQWWSTRMRKARRNCCINHETSNINVDEEAVLSFFETIGLYIRKNMISTEFVWESYSYYVERYFKVFETNLDSIRARDNTYFNNFIYLKSAFETMNKIKGIDSIPIKEKEMLAFINSEKNCYSPKSN
jgi:hypothetical protein